MANLTKLIFGIILLTLAAIDCPRQTQAQQPIEKQKPKVPAVIYPEAVLQGAAQTNLKPGEQPTAYILGAGDEITIDIFNQPNYSGTYLIPADGVLSLPLVGNISVLGLTRQQLTEKIGELYSSVFKRPLVTVNVMRVGSLTIGVIGEVTHPGVYTVSLRPGGGAISGIQYPTVTEMIKQAGGITLAADIRRIQVRRSLGLDREQVINLDIWDLMQTGNLTQDITIRHGDMIFVPTATTVNRSELRQLAAANFAAEPDQPRTVTVVGEVKKPGAYVLVGGDTPQGRPLGLSTLTRAIQLAGGITQAADIRRLQILRSTSSPTKQIIEVNLWQLLKEGDVNQDPIVQDSDVIVVPTATEINLAEAVELGKVNFSPEIIKVYVVGQRPQPSARMIEVPPNTPLNEALLAAGGFIDMRVRQSSVDLIRHHRNGTVSKRSVTIDLARGVNEQTNPPLLDNDIIVVSPSTLGTTLDITEAAGRILSPANPLRSLVGIFEVLGIIRRPD